MTAAIIHSAARMKVYEGPPVVLRPDYFGLHYHNYPGDLSAGQRVTNLAAVRLHDYSPTIAGVARGWAWNRIEIADWSALTDAQIDAQPHWAAIDAAIAEHTGRRIYMTLIGTPSRYSTSPTTPWAYGNTPGGGHPPSDLAAGLSSSWARYCRAVARRFANVPNVHLELWNEIDLQGPVFWFGAPTDLGLMQRIMWQSIKPIAPNIQLLSPSIASVRNTEGEAAGDLMAWRAALSASDGQGGRLADWVDGVSVHLYFANNTQRIPAMVSLLRRVMRSLGIGSLPLHNTEFGSLDFHTFNDADRNRMLKQAMVLAGVNSDGGCDFSGWYDVDGGDMGFGNGGLTVQAWNELVAQFANQSITAAWFVPSSSGVGVSTLRIVVNGIEVSL